MIINKRNKNTYIYNLLNNDNSIVRHSKFIKNVYNKNNQNTISQKLELYNNKKIIEYFDLFDNENNNIINIDGYYDSIENVKNIINSSISQYNESFEENINSELTLEEKEEINNLIQNNIAYIRLGIDPNKLHNNSDETEHIYFIKKLYETTIADYFNEFDNSESDYQEQLLNHNGLSPMYNDTILYPYKKHEYINNLFENLNNE